jgi:hypothetical protein
MIKKDLLNYIQRFIIHQTFDEEYKNHVIITFIGGAEFSFDIPLIINDQDELYLAYKPPFYYSPPLLFDIVCFASLTEALEKIRTNGYLRDYRIVDEEFRENSFPKLFLHLSSPEREESEEELEEEPEEEPEEDHEEDHGEDHEEDHGEEYLMREEEADDEVDEDDPYYGESDENFNIHTLFSKMYDMGTQGKRAMRRWIW